MSAVNAVSLKLHSSARSRAAIASFAKRVLVRGIGLLPCSLWPLASAIVRRCWPGFRRA
jgi:hypothetical protein